MLYTDLMGFQSSLAKPLKPTDAAIFLEPKGMAKLATLAEGDHTYLQVSAPDRLEIVKVTNSCGYITVERGFDGTTAQSFPTGSCVTFIVTPTIVRELICSTECCVAPCEPVAVAGATMERLVVGQAWSGTVIFSGSLPMRVASAGAPYWVRTTLGANYISYSGTPPDTTPFTLVSTATNGSGTNIVSRSDSVV